MTRMDISDNRISGFSLLQLETFFKENK